MKVLAVVGTVKGAFLLRSDGERRRWEVEGPILKGWEASTSARDPCGRWFLGIASGVYGTAIHTSDDLVRWRQIEGGPALPAGGPGKLQRIWRIHAQGPTYWCGVADAALFRSDDRGESWRPVEGLNAHPTRDRWQPGAGGLCAHAILVDPRDPRRIWGGISAVGVFRAEDDGRSWRAANDGVPVILEDPTTSEVGYCVHALVADPDDANAIWQQNHLGMFRTTDGGDRWEPIEQGLPSRFGFPLVLDPRTRALFAVPLESDEYRLTVGGRLGVYRSLDRGASWHRLEKGLPPSDTYTAVLRDAMAVDGLDPCGVYVGTTSGTVHVSPDRGETWTTLPATLPRILSVNFHAEA